MKIARNLIVLAALVAVLAASPPRAAAQTYLGELCWMVSEGPGPPCPSCAGASSFSPLKAGVTHLGGAYYLLQGRMDTPNGFLFLQATGVIIGDEIWIIGSTTQDISQDVPERASGIMQARLNLSTLFGPSWRIETDIHSTDLFNRYIIGAWNFVGDATSSDGRQLCP